jgi:seryl-tRNA synthetase
MSTASTHDCTSWPSSLLDVLERQRDIVGQLSQLAEAQTALMDSSQTDRLLELLGRRQSLIDEFTNTQVQLNELTQEMKLATVGSSQRERIKTLIDEIGAKLAHVMQRDEQDQALLRRNCDSMKAELASLGAGRQARSAYMNVTSGAQYSDRRC